MEQQQPGADESNKVVLNVSQPQSNKMDFAMPSAWAVRTRKITGDGVTDPYIRLGFTPEDYNREYNCEEVLTEVAEYYQLARTSNNIKDFDKEIKVIPIIPDSSTTFVVTIKDFVKVRGWYAINLVTPSSKSPHQKRSFQREHKPGSDIKQELENWKKETKENLEKEKEEWKKELEREKEEWKQKLEREKEEWKKQQEVIFKQKLESQLEVEKQKLISNLKSQLGNLTF
eukprot:CAMPEP_0174259422 /NCGR_PEP_ID=MMETSP0439-20130205/8247_1 /TAXON_ID=0 /ORGANISM="Stereomyxa ramosa, Strain Chinc5" /LENGTH=228 /DNA_ID=CAMNT_0015343301 /DNA_START=24 /DNA_END=710 /DNA_ORIENTATION=-